MNMHPARARSAHAIIGTLIILTLLGLTAGQLTIERVARMRSVDARQHRLQGREWALSAQFLAQGSQRQEDQWILRHEQDEQGGALWVAAGPRGTYIITELNERWIPRKSARKGSHGTP